MPVDLLSLFFRQKGEAGRRGNSLLNEMGPEPSFSDLCPLERPSGPLHVRACPTAAAPY